MAFALIDSLAFGFQQWKLRGNFTYTQAFASLGASIAALVLLSPLLLGIAIVLRVSQGPGVIFTQTRIGLHGRPFTIYKFRTMITDAEARYSEVEALSDTSGAAFKLPIPAVDLEGAVLGFLKPWPARGSATQSQTSP